ncbi:MAG: DUF3990 domain-containing protein [Bacilli bacterium]|nr:DUF3990 domain-containing protein [Bacilli bacterium]
MKLYYGSKTLLQQPIYGEGNPTNDYGLGFYLTNDQNLADLWACQYPEGGFTITYSINIRNLNILQLSDVSEESVLKWITLLVKHRFSYQQIIENKQVIDWLISHFDVAINQYDMIVGYRADDSYFNYSLGFVTGAISLETLTKAMKLGKLGLQYVLISKKSFREIQFVSSYAVLHKDDYKEFREKTLDEYHELLRQEDIFTNTFIGDLMKKYGK